MKEPFSGPKWLAVCTAVERDHRSRSWAHNQSIHLRNYCHHLAYENGWETVSNAIVREAARKAGCFLRVESGSEWVTVVHLDCITQEQIAETARSLRMPWKSRVRDGFSGSIERDAEMLAESISDECGGIEPAREYVAEQLQLLLTVGSVSV